MSRARWHMPGVDSDTVDALRAALDLQPVTARILCARGYRDAAAADKFLHPSLDHFHDPFLLSGMREAVSRLRSAIAGAEKILIYGDYDVDGASSVVILKTAIRLAGGAADFHIPNRLRDGYGLRSDVIERAAADGVRLIISVDTGIRATEVVEHAEALGVDIIVTDHHLPDEEVPRALAVINPNQHGCGYPEKNLCGAAVTLKLVHGLLLSLEWPAARVERLMASFLKLVAIATIADVVPLTGENRVIVKHGLEGLRDLRNPGLRALFEAAGIAPGAAPGADEIAFRIAPRINAAGRMADAASVVELLLTDDAGRARTIAAGLHALNRDRQGAEQDTVRAILTECERAPVSGEQYALVFSGAGWHRGVVGIVASRLVGRFCRPVFVLGEEGEEAQGSGRSIRAFHLLQALESMPDLFSRFGGHRQAAGVSLPRDRVHEFRERLNRWAAERLSPEDLQPRVDVDATARMSELSEAAIREVLALAPFGCGNPAPLLLIRDVEVANVSAINERCLRVALRQDGRALSAVYWGDTATAAGLRAGSRADVVLAIEQDRYAASRGWGDWSAKLKDMRPAECAAQSPALN